MTFSTKLSKEQIHFLLNNMAHIDTFLLWWFMRDLPSQIWIGVVTAVNNTQSHLNNLQLQLTKIPMASYQYTSYHCKFESCDRCWLHHNHNSKMQSVAAQLRFYEILSRSRNVLYQALYFSTSAPLMVARVVCQISKSSCEHVVIKFLQNWPNFPWILV